MMLWIAAVTGGLILVIIMAALTLTWLLNTASFKDRARKVLSDRLGDEVSFEDLHLSYFPPQGTIRELQVRSADINGTIRLVKADFRILPIVSGRLVINDISIHSPRLGIQGSALHKLDREKDAIPGQARKMVSKLLSRMKSYLPEGTLTVHKGSVDLFQEGKPGHRLQDITLEMQMFPERLDISLASASDIWESFRLVGSIHSDGSRASGDLDLNRLRIAPLREILDMPLGQPLDLSKLSFGLDFEADLFSAIQGSFQGRAVSKKMPDPLEIEKTRFQCKTSELRLRDFQARSGGAFFEIDSFRLGLQEKKNIRIESGSGEMVLDQTLPWLLPLVPLNQAMRKIAASTRLSGRIHISSLDLAGPLTRPEDWTATVNGTGHDLFMESEDLPSPVKVPQGAFEGTRERLIVRAQGLDFAGTALDIEGEIKDVFHVFDLKELSFQGTFSQRAIAWLKGRGIVPDWLHLEAPVSASRGTLGFDSDDWTVFTSELTLGSGQTTRMSLTRKPQHLRLDPLIIKDGRNKSSMKISWGEQELFLDFQGSLQEETVADLLVPKNLKGWLKGVFRLRLPREQPMDLRLQGNLQIGGFSYTPGLEAPVQVKSLQAAGRNQSISIDSADMLWGGVDIELKGTAAVSPQAIDLDLSGDVPPRQMSSEADSERSSSGKAVNTSRNNTLISGDFNLNGKVTANGSTGQWIDQWQGMYKITAADGRIYKYSLLADILAVVNITEIVKGQAPDVQGKGFGYSRAEASGKIEKGVLNVKEGFIKGQAVDLAFKGDVDMSGKRIDLIVLVTPLQTVDSIIEIIPVIGDVLGENFIAIPVRVTGDLSDPEVIPMPPSAVGKGLLGIVKRTLKLPITLVQPLLPDEAQ